MITYLKQFKRYIAVFLAAAIMLCASACDGLSKAQAANNNSETGTAEGTALQKYSGTFYNAFDTQITIMAYSASQNEFDAMLAMVEEDFNYYHRLFDIYHTYEGINNICSINSYAGTEPVEVGPEIIGLIKFGIELNRETNGKINIAMGSVLRLWHDARTTAEDFPQDSYVPEMSLLEAAGMHVNIEDIIIDEENSTIAFADPDLRLDVGAIAKGYATELVADKLESMGLSHIAINAGGNVKTIGAKPEGSWIIGIQNPDKNADSSYVKKVKIDSMSVVTSGVYERNFEFEGRVYHHIIDPDTLMPENRYQSVSILTEDSGLADAFSTALFNMSLEEGQAFADAHNINVMWIMNDFSIVMNDGFESFVQE